MKVLYAVNKWTEESEITQCWEYQPSTNKEETTIAKMVVEETKLESSFTDDDLFETLPNVNEVGYAVDGKNGK